MEKQENSQIEVLQKEVENGFEGALAFKHIIHTMNGEYTLVAENSRGSTNRSINVTIMASPGFGKTRLL